MTLNFSLRWCLLFLLLAGLNHAAAEEKLNMPPEGFVALFNGTDLTGWKGLVADPKKRAEMKPEELAAEQSKANEQMRRHWRAKDGILVFDG